MKATLQVLPTLIACNGLVGQTFPPSAVQVRKSGSGALRWTVTPPQNRWLSVSPMSGTNNGTLSVTCQTTGLGPGDYSTLFFVTSGAQSIQVSVFMSLKAVTIPPIPPTPPSNPAYGPQPSIQCVG